MASLFEVKVWFGAADSGNGPFIKPRSASQMSRVQVLVKRPRRTLGVLVAVLVAVGVAVGSGANFSAQTANPGNAFASGTLTMSNNQDGVAILGASNMKPGDSTQGEVQLQNTGSLAGTFSLNRTNLTDSDGSNPMSAKMNLVVRDCGADLNCGNGDDPPPVYNDTLANMNSAIALGNWAASEQHRYRFTATFDSSAGNAYQGDSTSARFEWDAAQ
jgi:spore coat-associated protein N